MNTLSPTHFQLLKNEVLSVAGIKNITPADCKAISMDIKRSTGQVISETTLKRMFGFALSKFNPSQYTIDLVSGYCGYESWRDFCDKKEQGYVEVTSEDIDWHVLKKNAATVTNFTLQALKYRSGIPYNQTISRGFVSSHMDEFTSSAYTATVFSAPVGYGKTVALCHWVEDKIHHDEITNSDDIVLFFSSHALMSALHSGKDLMQWLLAIVGYSADKDLRGFVNLTGGRDSKFYLIIDGFDPFFLKNDQFALSTTLISDILNLQANSGFLKLVLAMRPSSWLANRTEWENLNQHWFSELNEDNGFTNVPLFNCKEIDELRNNINPADNYPIDARVAQTLSHPAYFYYFYKQYKHDFSMRRVDNVGIYEIVAAFVANKIYSSLNSAEKLSLIGGIIEQMDFQNDRLYVNKLKITTLLKQNAGVYNELLSMGLFKEVNQSDNYHYDNCVHFADNNLLNHFIAVTLLNNNNNLFDQQLLNVLQQRLQGSSNKIAVLKWCLMDAVRTGQQHALSLIVNADLNISQKADVINFIGDMLKKESLSLKDADRLQHYFLQTHSEKLFDYLFGLELITTEYKTTLTNLLQLHLTSKQKVMLHTALAIIAIMQLDLNSLERCLADMEKITEDVYYTLPVNPFNCLDAVFHYLKYGFIKKQALTELTKLSFWLTDEHHTQLKESAQNDMLLLLGIYTLTLCNNPKKIIRLVKALNNSYRKYEAGTFTTHFHFFTALQEADARYKLNDHAGLARVYQQLSAKYSEAEALFTPFMKSLFLSVKIKLFANNNEEEMVSNELRYVNKVTENSGNKFPRVYILMSLLRNADFIDVHPHIKKQVGYEYNTLLNKSGIDRDRFPI